MSIIVFRFYCVECAKCPLNRNQLDTGDLPTIDLIREFHLSEYENHYEVIPGSIPSQRAYRLYRESNLTIHSYEAFPNGIPYHFWFESTFRARLQPSEPWYLFHVTNSHDVSQISVTMDPIQQLIGIGLPDILGNVQRVYFHHSSLFDRSWHKIMLSVVKDRATLWVDCQQVNGFRGEVYEPLLPRRKFDTNAGHAYISRFVDETNGFVSLKILTAENRFLID